MRKVMLFLFSVLLVLVLWACGSQEEIEKTEVPEPPLTVTVDPVPEPVEPTVNAGVREPVDRQKGAAIPQGGIVAAREMQAVVLSQQGGILLADLAEAKYQMLSGTSAAKVYFDGTQIYYTGDEGIYALSPETGEATRLTEHLSYILWIEGEKIYYIRQTDLASEQPVGELWCMDIDGSNAVLILATKIKGNFCLKDGWVYYVSAEDGALYRSMLYGSQVTKLVNGNAELCFVTDHGLYYKEKNGRQMLWRTDLKTGANIALGAYGEIVAAGDTIAIMARRENIGGNMENLFTLMVFDEQASELIELLQFENIGSDSLVWLQGEYVYLSTETGSVYRMALDDEMQTKEELFAGEAVFVGGRAWHIGADHLEIYDCATTEQMTIRLG